MANILLIDDSDSIRDLVASWLAEWGHVVIALNTGREVMRELEGKSVALIITDIYMPDVDGLEILRMLRGEFPGLPCIAMSSADGARDCLPIARALGAVATLYKPFKKEQLFVSVARALKQPSPAVAT